MTKGLIFDIKRFAVHDGPGIRTTIFFKGCPLSCRWCHNPESRDTNPQQSVRHLSLEGEIFEKEETTGKEITVREILQEVERDRIFYEESGGGVTISGGEPLFQIDFCTDLLQALKENGFHTALDTTGYAAREEIRRITPFVDLFLYDLKLMNDTAHQKYTGISNKTILDNLKHLLEEGKKVIIRFPIIPGITDTPSNIRSTIDFLKSMQQCCNVVMQECSNVVMQECSNAGMQPATKSPIRPFTFTHRSLGRGGSSPLEVHLLPYHAIAKNKYQRFRIDNMMKQGITIRKEELNCIKTIFESAGFRVRTGG